MSKCETEELYWGHIPPRDQRGVSSSVTEPQVTTGTFPRFRLLMGSTPLPWRTISPKNSPLRSSAPLEMGTVASTMLCALGTHTQAHLHAAAVLAPVLRPDGSP